MSKKNLVFIPVVKFFPTYAGWIKQTMNIVEKLPGLNFYVQTELVSGTSKSDFLFANLEVNRVKNIFQSYNFFSKTYFLLAVFFELLRKIKKIKCVYFPFSYYPAEGLLLICRVLGIKTVCRLSGGELGEYEKSLSTKIRIFSYKKATKIIVLNLEQKRYLLRKGFDTAKIVFIPNAVDLNSFENSNIADLRESLSDLDTNKVTVGYVGYMTERKGLLILLKSLQELDKEDQDRIQLLIIGPDEPVPNEEEYFETVNSAIQDCRFNIVKAGKVNSIASYYKLMDVYVLPSTFEGMPNALVEAMASETASIGSKIPGVVDIIDHQENGLLFETNNSQSLNYQINYLLKNELQRKTIAKSGLLTIQKKHNLDLTKMMYKELFT